MTEPTEQPAARPDDGRLVAGRYRLAELIGVGGMATVHRALDTVLGRTVAVKLLRREVIADADIAMRFRREALAATVLRHPNIVACLETGTDDGQPFMVMELIDGEDLAARLRSVGRVTPTEAARIGLDVARAIGVAHIRGIVHRDIKPGNILLARDGRAMVTDFGIARLGADAEGAVPGTTLGSVHYFSPEQAKGERTTAASDVYSLGLVLYESLTGQRAWRGETTAALATARIGAVAPSPQALRPEVPGVLDSIVTRALDPDPARRFPNGGAMAAALEPVVARPDPSSPTVATDTAALVAAAAAVAETGAAALAVGGGDAIPETGPSGSPVPPMRPADAAAPAARPPSHTGRVRRAPPAIAAPIVVLLSVVGIVGGALFLASLPGKSDPGGIALATASPRPSRTATPTPTARPTPDPTPVPTPKPTPIPVATVRPPTGGAFDLCSPILGFACALEKGTYEPSRFQPPVSFKLGADWSTNVSESDLIVLGRREGNLMFVGAIASVYPSGGAEHPPSSARTLVEAFIETDGIAAGKPADQKIDKRKAIVIDLAPVGPERVALFDTSTQTYYLEPFDTTRFVVIDGPSGPFLIAIEPIEDTTLEAIRRDAEPVVKTLHFR